MSYRVTIELKSGQLKSHCSGSESETQPHYKLSLITTPRYSLKVDP